MNNKDKKMIPDLVAAAQAANAGTDDGFWQDVETQLDAIEEAKKVPVEARLTVRRD